jgi:hypothetical protein
MDGMGWDGELVLHRESTDRCVYRPGFGWHRICIAWHGMAWCGTNYHARRVGVEFCCVFFFFALCRGAFCVFVLWWGEWMRGDESGEILWWRR